MAKDAKNAAPAGGEDKPKSKGKLLIIIAAVLVVVLAGGGAAAYFLLKNNDADSEESAPDQPKKKKEGVHAAPTYVSLDRFTVNLVPETGDQYLQVEVSVELEDLAAGEKLKLHMPKLRNQVMLLLSSKKASELNSKEGKEQLAKDMGDQMNQVLEPGGKGKGPVKEVLFTSFIIQ
jgi:flagellar FliL protein